MNSPKSKSGRQSKRLADFLPYQLSVASNAVSTRIAQQYRQRFGLKTTEWRIMAVLGDSGAHTQRELCLLTLMDKVPVNRACKTLEDRGLAARRPNERDGRSHLLELTDEGSGVHARIMPLAEAIEAELFGVLDAVERAALAQMLQRVREGAGEFDPAILDG
jgi:DNA-binding MarR family transcriptional regulator